MKRRLFLLALLPAACAEPQPPPVTTAPPAEEPEPVFAPGPIDWAELSEDQRRRARDVMRRLGYDTSSEEAIMEQWEALPPAKQRFAIHLPCKLRARQRSGKACDPKGDCTGPFDPPGPRLRSKTRCRIHGNRSGGRADRCMDIGYPDDIDQPGRCEHRPAAAK